MYIENKEDKVFIPQSKHSITANDYNQIKNEIQHAIELAGMTPEKDVIQLPAALKTLAEQSGAEELEKIASAGAEQCESVRREGAVQCESVQNAAALEMELARAWASKTDGPVSDGEFSAKKYAQDARASVNLVRDKAQADLSNVQVTSAAERFAVRPDGTGYLDILNERTNSGLSVGPDGTPNFRCNDVRYSVLSAKDIADYIVETGFSAGQWYRKYRSGWVEQGGMVTTAGSVTVNFLCPFSDADYTLMRTPLGHSNNTTGANVAFISALVSVWNKTATSFSLDPLMVWGFSAAHWYACGQGA